MKGTATRRAAVTADSWIECSLESIATTTSGGTPDRKRADFYGGGIPWVKSGELNDSYVFKTEESVTSDGLKNSSAKLFPAGTLLMAMYGATVGKTAVLKTDAATNQAVCAIFPDAEKAHVDFLRFYFISEREALLNQRYGGAQPNISQNIIRNFPVRLAPIPEQRKIAGVLGLVQQAIEQQERLLALTTELKKALLHRLFTEGLHGEPQKQTEIGLVPESWEVVPLGDVISEDPKNGLYKHSSTYGAGTPILRINDFSNDGDVVNSASNRVMTDVSENQLYALRKDDIVINRVNSLSHLGKTALIGELPEPMVFESNMVRFRVDEHRTLPHYVFRLLNSPVCKKQIIGSAKRAVAQSSINQGNIKAILLPLPPVDVQEEISGILETVVNKMRLHETKKESLAALFRTLLHQLMTAQIRVNGLDLSILKSQAI